MNKISPKVSPHLKTFVNLAIILVAFAILYRTTIANLIQDWITNDNYSHGFMVPFIAGYMIWHKKHQLGQAIIAPNNFGLLIIIFGMCIFIIGNIAAELFTMRTAVVVTIGGLCIYSFGMQVTTIIAVPIIYLMFMVPIPAIIWNKIAFPLQLLSAKFTSNVVQFIGISMLREGNILHLTNTSLEVVDACSGLRSLTSLLALSAAFAYIVSLSSISKWIMFLSAIPIAIAVNIIRLTTTAILATHFGPEVAQGFLHELSGIIIFLLAFILLYGLFILIKSIEIRIKTVEKR